MSSMVPRGISKSRWGQSCNHTSERRAGGAVTSTVVEYERKNKNHKRRRMNFILLRLVLAGYPMATLRLGEQATAVTGDHGVEIVDRRVPFP